MTWPGPRLHGCGPRREPPAFRVEGRGDRSRSRRDLSALRVIPADQVTRKLSPCGVPYHYLGHIRNDSSPFLPDSRAPSGRLTTQRDRHSGLALVAQLDSLFGDPGGDPRGHIDANSELRALREQRARNQKLGVLDPRGDAAVHAVFCIPPMHKRAHTLGRVGFPFDEDAALLPLGRYELHVGWIGNLFFVDPLVLLPDEEPASFLGHGNGVSDDLRPTVANALGAQTMQWATVEHLSIGIQELVRELRRALGTALGRRQVVEGAIERHDAISCDAEAKEQKHRLDAAVHQAPWCRPTDHWTEQTLMCVRADPKRGYRKDRRAGAYEGDERGHKVQRRGGVEDRIRSGIEAEYADAVRVERVVLWESGVRVLCRWTTPDAWCVPSAQRVADLMGDRRQHVDEGRRHAVTDRGTAEHGAAAGDPDREPAKVDIARSTTQVLELVQEIAPSGTAATAGRRAPSDRGGECDRGESSLLNVPTRERLRQH